MSMNEELRTLVLEMRDAYDAVGPFIEEKNSDACPRCESVCCIDRHGTHDAEDLLFVAALSEALGETVKPLEPPKADDTEPCRHLGPKGCRIERWRRPYRCTWYFCDSLLTIMPEGNKRVYRQFISRLDNLKNLRHALELNFHKKC
ncbi:hypothetical protein ACFLZI_01830 [Nitrospirota bacterium]